MFKWNLFFSHIVFIARGEVIMAQSRQSQVLLSAVDDSGHAPS